MPSEDHRSKEIRLFFRRIGDHKIVIARPHQMGMVKAAQYATTVSQQFPNVRFALMVGIGASVPSLPTVTSTSPSVSLETTILAYFSMISASMSNMGSF